VTLHSYLMDTRL